MFPFLPVPEPPLKQPRPAQQSFIPNMFHPPLLILYWPKESSIATAPLPPHHPDRFSPSPRWKGSLSLTLISSQTFLLSHTVFLFWALTSLLLFFLSLSLSLFFSVSQSYLSVSRTSQKLLDCRNCGKYCLPIIHLLSARSGGCSCLL